MLSMTGFGSGEAPAGNGQVVLTARAINHRYLDVRIKTSPELVELIDAIEASVRKALNRGRIEINARLEIAAASSVRLDAERAQHAFRQLQALRAAIAPEDALPLTLLATVPGLFVETTAVAKDDLLRATEAALRNALESLTAMRQREGSALLHDMQARIDRVRALAAVVATRAPDLVTEQRRRLTARVGKLLADGSVAHDPGRLEQEIAIFADRIDVTEEITRLCTHCDHFMDTTRSDEAVGRKLDFLLQEMGRETNTIGSKIADAAVTHTVVEIKTELERVREQVQNVL